LIIGRHVPSRLVQKMDEEMFVLLHGVMQTLGASLVVPEERCQDPFFAVPVRSYGLLAHDCCAGVFGDGQRGLCMRLCAIAQLA
jgi:hypothetical protein